MPARYDRELIRRWFGEPKKWFDSCTKSTKTFAWDDVWSCGVIFRGMLQGRDSSIVHLTKKIALLKGADEPVVLPKKIPLSRVLAGDTKGLRQDAIKEAKAFAKRVGSGAEPAQKVVKGPKPTKGPPKVIKASVPRGVELVELAIAKLAGSRPLAARDVEKLTLDGKKLPPSLARWLRHDSSRVECFATKKLEKSTFLDLCSMLRLDIEPNANPLPGGDCYLLMQGADMVQFLYVGRADATGEYPVMTLDTDDTPAVILEAPGFDVWIAKLAEAVAAADVYGAVPKGYEPFMKEAARLNLGGTKEIDV